MQDIERIDVSLENILLCIKIKESAAALGGNSSSGAAAANDSKTPNSLTKVCSSEECVSHENEMMEL